MKNYFIFACAICFISSNAQNVGINTTAPTATFDINGNLRVRTVPTTAAAPTYNFLVANASNEVEKINGNFASATNTTIAKAADSDGFSLLGVDLFGGYEKIDFTAGTVSINPGSAFSASTDDYTVPSDGIYEIFYYFRYGTGIQASLISTFPRIGILKTTGVTTTVAVAQRFQKTNFSK